MKFEDVVLSDIELKALEFLGKHSGVIVEKENEEILKRLEHFEFAEFYTIADPAIRKLAVEKTGKIAPQGAKIIDRGRDYISYISARNSQVKKGFFRDLLFLILGALITFLFDHYLLFVELCKKIFQCG